MEQVSTDHPVTAEQPKTEGSLTDQQREGLQQQFAEGVQALGHQDQAHAAKLGEIAQGHAVIADSHGVVLTPREKEAVARGETDINK